MVEYYGLIQMEIMKHSICMMAVIGKGSKAMMSAWNGKKVISTMPSMIMDRRGNAG